MRNEYCTMDNFAASITSLIGNVFDECDSRVSKAVEQSARKGAKELRETYALIGEHEWSDEYREGFRAYIDKTGGETIGEVGNKNKPGLVHLLEKGHATLTGRRTRSYPHMEPAFEEMSEDFVKRVDKSIGEALEG